MNKLKYTLKGLLIFLFIALVLSCKYGVKPKQRLKKDRTELNDIKSVLTDNLRSIYKRGTFAGFGVAIVNQDSILYSNGFGYANISEQKKYTNNSVQNIASISKTMLGISLLKAQEQGLLKIDDPVNKYLPFKILNPYYPKLPITIKQLATHTSTITDTDYYNSKSYLLQKNEDLENYNLPEINEKFNTLENKITIEDFLRNLLVKNGKWYNDNNYLNNPPQVQFKYSNIGATLAAFIIEQVSNKPYYCFVQDNVLTPLKMVKSGWSMNYENPSLLSIAYFDTNTPLPKYTGITYPDGGIMTNINDLSLYLIELINGYQGSGTILTNNSYKQIFTKYLNNKELKQSYDYDDEFNSGIFMGYTPNNLIGHTGGDPGVVTAMFFSPKTKIGIIVLINTSINDDKSANHFFDILHTLSKYQNQLIR